MMACQTRRENDELVCSCGLRWDVDDSDPPICRHAKVPPASPVSEHDARVAAAMTATVPIELPVSLADEMFRTLQYARGTGSDHIEAMRRAWRLMLDRCAL